MSSIWELSSMDTARTSRAHDLCRQALGQVLEIYDIVLTAQRTAKISSARV
jgi:hypothetical protein